jgi:murein DD-endopeptidase MepM/ murein hydrolase activator NlpD
VVVLLASAPPALGAWTWPLAGEVITPYRNGADPYAGGQHRGVDIAGAVGAPVVAAAAGEVLFAGTAGSSGVTVSIRTGEGLDTSYLHLSSVAVRKGQQVSAGERVGAVGTSGRRSAEAPHLHFGVRESGSRHAYRDPLSLLPPPPVAAPENPQPVPAPVGGPVPVTPDPAPVPAPSPLASPEPLSEPRRAPVHRRVPAGRRVPVHGGVPAADPSPATSPTPSRSPLRNVRPAPALEPGTRQEHGRVDPAPRPARVEAGPRQAAAHTPGADGAQHGPAASRSPGSSFVPRPESASGPDIALALACLGLLAAAALLGLTSEGRETARRGAGKLSTLLRPLAGRG